MCFTDSSETAHFPLKIPTVLNYKICSGPHWISLMPAVAPRKSCVLVLWPLVMKSLFLLVLLSMHGCTASPALLELLAKLLRLSAHRVNIHIYIHCGSFFSHYTTCIVEHIKVFFTVLAQVVSFWGRGVLLGTFTCGSSISTWCIISHNFVYAQRVSKLT